MDAYDLSIDGDEIVVDQGSSGIVLQLDEVDQFVRDLLTIKAEQTLNFEDPFEGEEGLYEFGIDEQAEAIVEEMLRNACDY